MANTAEKGRDGAGLHPAGPGQVARRQAEDFRPQLGGAHLGRRDRAPLADFRHLAYSLSSFRDRDQISATGWWMSPFSVELTFPGPRAGRRPASGPKGSG